MSAHNDDFVILRGADAPPPPSVMPPIGMLREALASLEVGDFLFVPESFSRRGSVSPTMTLLGRKLGRCFVSRTMEHEGVPGRGIWRVEGRPSRSLIKYPSRKPLARPLQFSDFAKPDSARMMARR